ncbi:uncharacterized protein LOC129227938 [Uloborus diversus]|uniref:uncharacterized protein LOC129227938 n=1 Tax=Uloborus diversus TaxID=327109 RepID=UPI002408FD2E|nr:uncharacterized protein LOC129227938 [Uloborus diversus]
MSSSSHLTPPTYYGTSSNSTLDIALLKCLNYHTRISAVTELSSDHCPVFLDIGISMSIPEAPFTSTITSWSYYTKIIHDRIQGNPTITSISDIDNCISTLTDNMKFALERASIKKFSKRLPLRFPPNIINLIKYKNRIKKHWQLSKDPAVKTRLNAVQNEIKKLTGEHKSTTFNNYLGSLDNNSKAFYTLVRKFSNKTHIMPTIHADHGKLVYTTQDKASAIASTLEDNFQLNAHEYDEDTISDVNRSINRFFQAPPTSVPPPIITPLEIMITIKHLPVRKAGGEDATIAVALPDIDYKSMLMSF